MAKPLKPLINSGGHYPSKKWIPLVRGNGYTTKDGGGEEPECRAEKLIDVDGLDISETRRINHAKEDRNNKNTKCRSSE